jgi:hypothetical protein
MSTITTSASSFSATLRATVAPTLPAPPTTVTLRFIQHSSVSASVAFIFLVRVLGRVPTRTGKRSTEIVENPVEKIVQNRLCADQTEQFSGLHHGSAIASPTNGHRQNRRIIL